MSDQAFKHKVGPAVVRELARSLEEVESSFDRQAFESEGMDGLEALELKARIDHLATVLRRHLPEDYEEALRILVASLGRPLEVEEGFGDVVFFYWIHAHFVQIYGLEHPGPSLDAMLEITKRSTSEFAVRPFLVQHREMTLEFLHRYLEDPNPHVRRWISEGTRPRLPWGLRLKDFVEDPSPTLPLLRALRRDESAYVRTSVANHLNDIAKDHPEIAVDEVRAFMNEGFEHAPWIAKKALRHLLKQGHRGALEALGFSPDVDVELSDLRLDREIVRVGEALKFEFELTGTGDDTGNRGSELLKIHYAVNFVLARGKTGRKVYELGTRKIRPGETLKLKKSQSFRPITTRKYYPGAHGLAILVNGRELARAEFELAVPG